MKIFTSMMTTRVANNKYVDSAKKNFALNKKLATTAISRTLSKLLHDKQVDPVLVSREYWAGHDVTRKTIAERVMAQYGKRCSVMSHRASTECTLEDNSPYMHCLKQLLSLCELEYDSIRYAAISKFGSIITRIHSKQMNAIVKSLLSAVGDPGTSYYKAAGAIELLRSSKVQKRLAGSFEMIKALVDCLAKAPALLTVIPRQDHRERLLDGLTDVIVRFSSTWHQPPLPVNDPLPEDIMKTVLELNGFDVNGNSVTFEMKAGLRMETLYAYLLSHMIGNGMQINNGLIEWCVFALRHQTGQPSQLIALACLTKLVRIAAMNCGNVPACEAIASSFTAEVWTEILAGFSACQPRRQDDGDSPQWSRGIDQLLDSVHYIRNVLPRAEANELDNSSFSGSFFRQNAAMITDMLRVFYPKASVDTIDMLLLASEKLTHTNEHEARANVVTRAELFSGIYRLCNSPPLMATPVGSAIDQRLSRFLEEQVERVSYDMTRIWAEAVVFSCSVAPSYPSQHTVSMILNKCRSNRRPFEEEDSFSTQAKGYMLLRGLLTADTYASIKFGEPASMIGAVVTEIINSDDAQLCFPYRTIREEVGSILGMLVCSSVGARGESTPASRLSFLIHSATSEPLDIDVMEGTIVEGAQSMKGKYAIETATMWLEYIVETTPLYRSTDVMSTLLLLSLEGCGHKDIEVARHCQQISLLAVNSLRVFQRYESDALSATLANLISLFKASSWKVKEQVLVSLSLILMNNGFVMTSEEKKLCKGLFVESFIDSRFELQIAARIGLTIYFSTKTIAEINALATAYSKNCEIIADRSIICIFRMHMS